MEPKLLYFSGKSNSFKIDDQATQIGLIARDGFAVRHLISGVPAQVLIRNESGFLKAIPATPDERMTATFTTDMLADLPIGQYLLELWIGDDGKRVIYPDGGFLSFTISENAKTIGDAATVIPTLSLDDYEKRFNAIMDEATKRLSEIDPSKVVAVKGDPGPKGDKGDKGDVGPQGPQSPKGDPGDAGSGGGLTLPLPIPIMSYAVDTSSVPYTAWFNDGQGFVMPDYGDNKALYAVGRAGINLYDGKPDMYSPFITAIKVANGQITADKLATLDEAYWAPSTKIINPKHSANDYDWSNAYLDNAGTYKAREKEVIRVLYQLGAISGAVAEQYGAVKK